MESSSSNKKEVKKKEENKEEDMMLHSPSSILSPPTSTVFSYAQAVVQPPRSRQVSQNTEISESSPPQAKMTKTVPKIIPVWAMKSEQKSEGGKPYVAPHSRNTLASTPELAIQKPGPANLPVPYEASICPQSPVRETSPDLDWPPQRQKTPYRQSSPQRRLAGRGGRSSANTGHTRHKNQPRQPSPSKNTVRILTNIPRIVDVASLKVAVENDPEHVFRAFKQMVDEQAKLQAGNEILRKEAQGVKENWMDVSQQLQETQRNLATVETQLANTYQDFNASRQDWICRAGRYEELLSINSGKQVLLFKYIDRLNKERYGGKSHESFEASPPTLSRPTLTRAHSTLPETGFDKSGVSCGSTSSTTTITDWRGSPERIGRFDPKAITFVPGSASPTKSTTSVMSQNSGPDADLLAAVVSLPPRFYGICPFSLTHVRGKCSKRDCKLRHLCPAYTSDIGAGCLVKECRLAHEYRTCHFEVDHYGCKMVSELPQARGCTHMLRTAHKVTVSPEEWSARITVARLRDAHREGKY